MYDKKQLTKIVSALIISDGHLTKPVGKGNSRLEIYQTENHKDFILYLSGYLGQLTSLNIAERTFDKEAHKTQIKITTKKLPFYTRIRERFYLGGKKVVDKHCVTLLDAEFLAVWYMCDGTYFYRESNSSHILNLCTESFSYGDHLLLQKALWEKLGLNFKIHKRGNSHRLYLPVKEYKRFLDLISPYVVDSFRYKLPKI